MYSSTALVCIVDLIDLICVGWHVTYSVYSRSDRSHMCRLACNVCGGITAVVFSYVGGSSTSLDRGSLWIGMVS